MKHYFNIVLSAVFICVLVIPVVHAQKIFEAYPLGQNDAAPLKQSVEAIVGEDGAVILDIRGNRLMVITECEQHRAIADIFSKIPLIGKNVRIEVRFVQKSTTSEAGASISASGEISTENGANITIKPKIIDTVTTSSGETVQSILTASGSEAKIQVGTSVPQIDWFIDFGWRWSEVHERLYWTDVGAFLTVKPTIVGEGPVIKVILTPEICGIAAEQPCNIQFTRASMEILVKSGSPMNIGSLNKDEEFYSRFLVGGTRVEDSYAMDMILTAWITDVTAPTPVE